MRRSLAKAKEKVSNFFNGMTGAVHPEASLSLLFAPSMAIFPQVATAFKTNQVTYISLLPGNQKGRLVYFTLTC